MPRKFGPDGTFGDLITGPDGTTVGQGRCPCCDAMQKIKKNKSNHLYYFCSAANGCGLKLQGQAFHSDVFIANIAKGNRGAWIKGNANMVKSIIARGGPQYEFESDDKPASAPAPAQAQLQPKPQQPKQAPPAPQEKPKKGFLASLLDDE